MRNDIIYLSHGTDIRRETEVLMDIPSLSMALSQNRVLTDVGVAMLSKNLDFMKDVGSNFAEQIDSVSELSVNPNVGSNIDIRL